MMRKALVLFVGVCLQLIAAATLAQAPIVENELKHDTSPPLRGMPAAPRELVTPRIKPIELIPTRAGRRRAIVLDAVEQLAPGPAAAFSMVFPPVARGPHVPPLAVYLRESQKWFDETLGPVK